MLFTEQEKQSITKELSGMQPSSIIIGSTFTRKGFVAIDIDAYNQDKEGISESFSELNKKYGLKQAFQTPTHFVYKIINALT